MKLLHIIITSLLLGCDAGNGENLNVQGQHLNPEVETIIPITSDEQKSNLQWIQDNVFTPICSECHGGVNPAAGQNLSNIEASAKSLINIDSFNPNFKRVLPGSPFKSYLYLKIIGDSQAGSRMPLGKPALSEEAINAITQWISLGALVPNESNLSTQVSNLTVTTKQYHESKSATLTIWFNRPLSLNTLYIKQILVKAITQNSAWLITDEKISLSIINTHKITINVSHIPLEVSQLMFSLSNSSISSITSINGQLLDGNFDDLDGGEFNYEINF